VNLDSLLVYIEHNGDESPKDDTVTLQLYKPQGRMLQRQQDNIERAVTHTRCVGTNCFNWLRMESSG